MTTPRELPAVCLIDWGIGGFGVVRALLALEPRARLGYFSDSGTTPYGKLSARALRMRLERVIGELAARGVRHVVLACNAASTVAHALSVPPRVSVSEIIGPGVALVREARVRRVGIVGGARTIRAGRHARALRAEGIDVVARVAQPLSAHVEAGRLDGAAVRADIERIVEPLRDADALLLACTHYPALLPRFIAALPRTTMLDPAAALAQRIVTAQWLDRSRGGATIVAMTSGSPVASRTRARAAFDVDPGAFHRARFG